MDLTRRKQEIQFKKINELANYIALEYSVNHITNLDKITSDELIRVLYDHYENCFDGLLVYDSGSFIIHLNIDKGNHKDSQRSRFSVAHELGHYFITEHHKSIIDGTFPCHPSLFKPKQSNLIEQEADYFAACLLMPSTSFKDKCYRKKFSLDLVNELSEHFNASKVSALLRFADIDAGTYPLMISFFKDGVLSGYKQSPDFPYRNVPFKSKIGHAPPPTSVIGEYYLKKESKFKDVQEVYVYDWFWRNSNQKLNEQCFYSDYGYDISVLWFD